MKKFINKVENVELEMLEGMERQISEVRVTSQQNPNPELLEQALRVFDGIALYDGTWELDEDIFDYFRQHYGLVAL